jgi:casein kinase II subunit beta
MLQRILIVLALCCYYVASTTEWIRKFCSLPGNERLCEVPLSFIEDPLLVGAVIRCAMDEKMDPASALRLIMGKQSRNQGWTDAEIASTEDKTQYLYTLIHAKYVTSNIGLKEIRQSFERADFGRCPRISCAGYPLLPIGLDDKPRRSLCHCFCGACRELYRPQTPQLEDLDGAYFGPTLPHLFFQRNVDLAPVRANSTYIPRIFGFRISNKALELQRYSENSEKVA